MIFKNCTYYKIFSQPGLYRRIDRNVEILRSVLSQFKGSVSESDISWFRFTHVHPQEIPLSCPLPPARSTEKWIATHLNDPIKTLFGVEAFQMVFSSPEKSRTFTFFKALFLKLVDMRVLDILPKSFFPRLFFYKQTTEGSSISANSDWHVDFLQSKPLEEVEALVSKTSLYCICTLTIPNGPSTWLLDTSDIEIPLLTQHGPTRATIINQYLDTLIAHNLVSASPLKPNTWYLVHSNQIHRGPRLTDPFEKADRAFLHVTGIIDHR